MLLAKAVIFVWKGYVHGKEVSYNITHLPQDKMDAISQTTTSVNEKFCILIKISLKLVTEGPIDNNSALF